MSLSACDVGNPVYERSGPAPKKGQGIARAQIWFDQGNRSEMHNICFEWEEGPDGAILYVSKPMVNTTADDLELDVVETIEQEIDQRVLQLNWLSPWHLKD